MKNELWAIWWELRCSWEQNIAMPTERVAWTVATWLFSSVDGKSVSLLTAWGLSYYLAGLFQLRDMLDPETFVGPERGDYETNLTGK